MHLTAYHFDGDPDALKSGYDELTASFPPDAVLLNLCVVTSDGLTVIDACPTKADFEAFSTSVEFRDALVAAGLPTPRIEPLGPVLARHGTALAAPTPA